MRNVRIIARLDIKGSNLIKGIHLEGLRVMGSPNQFAQQYYHEGVDELVYMDCVASLYGRNSLVDVVRSTAENIFVPMTVGGGIRTVDDIETLLRAGADKVAINTAAVSRPGFISEATRVFGSQCIVLSVEAKRRPSGGWEAYTDNGRERTGLDAIDWAKKAVDLGVGEILLTSVDQEGTQRGFDIPLVAAVAPHVAVPVIASGGMGQLAHVTEVCRAAHADAVAIAGCLHYGRFAMASIRDAAKAAAVNVRTFC